MLLNCTACQTDNAADARFYMACGTALASPFGLDRAPGRGFPIEDLGEFDFRGIPGRIRVHELHAARSLRTRFDASKARGLSRFVGRSAEMAALEESLAEAQGGQEVGASGYIARVRGTIARATR